MVEQPPLEWKNVSPEPYPWKKSYSWKNKTFFGPTFPFPQSPGLSSLAALGRQLSCRMRKVKSWLSESFVLPRIRSFRGKVRGIYILSRLRLVSYPHAIFKFHLLSLFKYHPNLNKFFNFHVCLFIPLFVSPFPCVWKLSILTVLSKNDISRSCLVCIKSEKYGFLVTLWPLWSMRWS